MPGGDDNNWGTILNDFLAVEHTDAGVLRKAADITQAKSDATTALTNAATASSNAATALSAAQSAQTTASGKYTKPGSGIPETDLTTAVQAKLNAAQTVQRTFVGNSAPTGTTGNYVWVQTGLGVGGTDMTFWVEDGQ